MKILIVDDHPLFRAGFHAVLEQSSLEAGVISVSSVTEALQTLQRDPAIFSLVDVATLRAQYATPLLTRVLIIFDDQNAHEHLPRHLWAG